MILNRLANKAAWSASAPNTSKAHSSDGVTVDLSDVAEGVDGDPRRDLEALKRGKQDARAQGGATWSDDGQGGMKAEWKLPVPTPTGLSGSSNGSSGAAAGPDLDLTDFANVDPRRGLSDQEVLKRREQYGPNALPEKPGKSILSRFIGQYQDPISGMLPPAALFYGALGHGAEAGGIGFVSLLNSCLGTYMEIKAEKSMDALKQQSVTEATVVREGQDVVVPAKDLVPGDVIKLAPGDITPADALLLDSQDLATDEAALTGESEQVKKDHTADVPDNAGLHERTNMVFSGTPIKKGSGLAVVVKTGAETEVGKIAAAADVAEPPPSPLMRQTKDLSKQFAVIGGVTAVALGGLTAAGSGWLPGVFNGISSAVAIVPEGMPALTTLVKSQGISAASKRNVLIQNPNAVETIGSTTVVCTDKTGTLTTGEMTGRLTWSPSFGDEKATMLGALFGSTAKKQDDVWLGAPTEIATLKYIENLPDLKIETGAKDASGQTVKVTFTPEVEQEFKLTESEFNNVQEKLAEGEKADAVLTMAQMVQERGKDYPFGSERKMHTLAIPGEVVGQEGHYSFTTGALARVIEKTNLSDEQKAEIQAKNDELASQGYRVIAMARKQTSQLGETGEMESDLEFSGLMAIQDPLREGVKESVAELQGAGIRVKVITGDQLLTAKSIGAEAGILESDKTEYMLSEEMLDQHDPKTSPGRAELARLATEASQAGEVVMAGKWLDVFTDEDGPLGQQAVSDLIDKTGVFYRVEPRHKLKIVETLQDRDEVVAMTGDGVNDAPAISQADTGVAMGIRGTEATQQVADIILSDDSFNSIAEGVRSGRRIRANIQKTINYTLSSNLAEVVAMGATAATTLALGSSLPGLLTPLQILWVNLATDSFPSFGLGVEKAEGDLMKEPPKGAEAPLIEKNKWGELATIGGYMGLATAAMYLAPTLFAGTEILGMTMPAIAQPVAQTMAFNFLAVGQCVNALNARKLGNSNPLEGLTKNKTLMLALAGTVAAQVALPYIPGVSEVMGVTPLSLGQWGAVAATAATVLPVGMAAKRIFGGKKQAVDMSLEELKQKQAKAQTEEAKPVEPTLEEMLEGKPEGALRWGQNGPGKLRASWDVPTR